VSRRVGRTAGAGAGTGRAAAGPVVALVGRPNVGKSSLFNRLVGGRPALVEDRPGVTRDRRYGAAEWGSARFRVVDTGGLDPSAAGILGAMRAQTLRAVEEADLLLLVLDAAEGLTAVDREVGTLLRRTSKPVVVAANKVDSAGREVGLGELYGLGFPDLFAVSAGHGRGVGELLDRVVELLGPRALIPEVGASADAAAAESPEPPPPPPLCGSDDAPGDVAAGPIRIAFVGKPNVGKSSLVNRLLGEERVLVHDQPGTTRDPVDTPFESDGRSFVLVDTAGLRRRRSVDTLTEAVAAKMARDQLARCDVAALVVDAAVGATAEDARIGSLIEEAGRAMVLVLNKKDLVPRAEIDGRVSDAREVLSFLGWAPAALTSARTGAGVADIAAAAARVFAQAARRIPTAEVNRFLEALVAEKPPPAGPGGRHVRLYYGTQAGVHPPTFVISTNQPAAVPFSYRRFLVNQLRRSYGFEGTPIRIALRSHRKKPEGAPAAKQRSRR
jgi:GTP-binding protein